MKFPPILVLGGFSITEISYTRNTKGGEPVIYTRIKELAAKQGITIGQLEVAIGIPRTAMQEWNAHMPAADKLLKVAKYFGVTVEELLEGVA